MIYDSVIKAKFIERPNRFIAKVNIIDTNTGEILEENVHVKNTGRCKEILVKGTDVFLEPSKNPLRKTKYSLISAFKGNNLINIDSQVPNYVVFEALKQGLISEIQDVNLAKREVTYGNSRFDIYFENNNGRGFIEIKGVTLENSGAALFPDAPTIRGTKHILEMIEAVKEGYNGYIFFLIQMKGVNSFTPNAEMDSKFASALNLAAKSGVHILAYDSIITKDSILIDKPVKIIL